MYEVEVSGNMVDLVYGDDWQNNNLVLLLIGINLYYDM